MSKNPFDKYKQAQVMTSTKEQLLLLMYRGAIKFLKQAIEANNQKNLSEKAVFVGKVQAIITELRATLNFDASQEIASELERLYDFISDRLLKANQDPTSMHLEESLKILVTLNEAWEGAVSSLQKEKATTGG